MSTKSSSTSTKGSSGNKKKSLILAALIDIVLGAIIILAFGPTWVLPTAYIELYLSWSLVIAILAVPTIAILRYGWKEKITSKTYLLPARIGFGFFFLKVGLEKVVNPAFFASPGILALGPAAPSPFITAVLGLLEANYLIFLPMAAFGEVLIGLSFLVGGFTRLGALGGILMMLNYLVLFYWLGASTYGINLLGVVTFFAVGMERVGRTFGLDKYLGPWLEKSKNKILQLIGLLT